MVMYHKTKPGNNPEDFMHCYDHGGSLQSHTMEILCETFHMLSVVSCCTVLNLVKICKVEMHTLKFL